MFAVLVKNVDV